MKNFELLIQHESRLQTSRRSNMGSTFPEGGLFADNNEFCFQAVKRSDMNCAELQGGLFADCQEWNFRLRNVQIREVPSCKKVDLLMLRNSVFRVRKVEI